MRLAHGHVFVEIDSQCYTSNCQFTTATLFIIVYYNPLETLHGFGTFAPAVSLLNTRYTNTYVHKERQT